MITPSNTPDARFEAVSEEPHVNLEGMQMGFSNFKLWVWFLKMRKKFPRSLAVVNQSSVLHQKLLSLLGLRLDLAGQLPRKLCWKQSRFFSRFPP